MTSGGSRGRDREYQHISEHIPGLMVVWWCVGISHSKNVCMDEQMWARRDVDAHLICGSMRRQLGYIGAVLAQDIRAKKVTEQVVLRVGM